MTEYISEFPKDINQTKWIVGSSFFFLVPAYISYSISPILSTVSVLTSAFSINHWRKAEDGPRRFADRIMAWIAFFIYVVVGFVNLPIIISITSLSCITFSYCLSNYLSEKNHIYWHWTHMLFHCSVALTKCIIIYNLYL